jgi:hypothetical protein
MLINRCGSPAQRTLYQPRVIGTCAWAAIWIELEGFLWSLVLEKAPSSKAALLSVKVFRKRPKSRTPVIPLRDADLSSPFQWQRWARNHYIHEDNLAVLNVPPHDVDAVRTHLQSSYRILLSRVNLAWIPRLEFPITAYASSLCEAFTQLEQSGAYYAR